MILDDLARVESGEVTAGHIIDAALQRARSAQPTTNAFTHLPPAARAGNGPLAGVAIAAKDLIDQRGIATTCGSSFLRKPAISTAPALTNLEAAGVTVLGRTNLHEFAFGFSSENDWFGPVRNPLDLSTSAGGSSGGSAAAVAAGVVDVAIGTDTGGSVRVPAALCGLVGLKVTHGRIDTKGVFPLAPTLDTVGPIARSITDAAIAFSALLGEPVVQRPVSGAIAGLRIGIPRPWVDHPATTAVRAAFTMALDRLSDLGAHVIDVDAATLEPPGAITPSAYFEVAAVHRAWFTEDAQRYGPAIRDRLEAAMAVSDIEHEAALEWRRSVTEVASSLLEKVDVIATPTVGAMRKTIGEDMISIDGAPHHYRTVLSQFTALVNHLGLPALAVPLAAPGTPPPSLQLIGARGAETALLSIGIAMEDAEIIA